MTTTPPRVPRQTVLVVDDTPANLNLLAGLLGTHYRVQLATSGAKALELAERTPPDLILLDVMMPAMDGWTVCARLKAHPLTRDVPVLFVTALSQPADEQRAFEAGAADFVTKPFHPATVLARVGTQLQLKGARDALARRNVWLEGELERRLAEAERLRDTSLFLMVGLAEFRDNDTGQHIVRTQEYVRTLARWLVVQPERECDLEEEQIDAMARAAPLHDIGKVAIPDHILLKPGKLDAEEWAVMKTHAARGADLLQRAAERLGHEAGPLLRYGAQIARHHHEKWDGSGYPDALAGRDIPLAARLMAVADVYDALISVRPYKPAFTHEAALAFVEQGAGAHFDPLLARGLRECEHDILHIARTWHD